MTTALQRLLKYPHAAVFDKAPGADLALRVRHDAGAVWVVADEVMTVTAGALERSYDLAEFTIGSLAQALQDDGFQVPTIAQEWLHRSALTLVEGRGDQGESNGDHVQAFTSLLWVLLSGYAVEVREAEHQVEQALLQMSIKTADGGWLDLWGGLYGVPRLQDELDAEYRPRIEREAFRIRVSVGGIEQAILDGTGFDVRIEEPWKEIFTLDQSALSGPDRIYDGERYGYHLIRPVTREPSVNWDAVLRVIHRNRAAGVLLVGAEAMRSSEVDGAGAVSVSGLTNHHPTFTLYEDRALLDFSTIEEVSTLNHDARHRREIRHISNSVVGPLGWIELPWLPVTWDSSSYLVFSKQSREYRVHYINAEYSSQYWAPVSWSSINTSWADAGAIIYSGHSRS